MQTMASSELKISTNGLARFATAVIASWRPGLTKRKANLAEKIRRPLHSALASDEP
jgi:hypothetical protein